VLAVPALLHLGLGINVPWGSVSVASPETTLGVAAKAAEGGAETAAASSASTTPVVPVENSGGTPAKPQDMSPTDKAELNETARLLAVLLDSGRVVVGRVQPTINNPRLADKGFSSVAFESQLRQEFLVRTGYDLRNLASAAMPDRAKPLLTRLAFFMQKAVHDVQPDINRKGIGFKGFIPATFGTQVAEQFSKDTGLTIRQIGPPGVAPRNPNNKPDPLEEQALVAMQKSHPRAGDHVLEQALSQNSVRVLLPLFYKKQCLTCHGKPKGEVDISGYEKEGFKEGDLGGAISVILANHASNGKE
jgi:general secretion pathway protein A